MAAGSPPSPPPGRCTAHSLEGEEEAAGDHDEAEREEENAAVPRQHEATAAIEAVPSGENLPFAALAVGRGGGGGGRSCAWPGGLRGGGRRSRGAGRNLPVLAVLHSDDGGGPCPPHRAAPPGPPGRQEGGWAGRPARLRRPAPPRPTGRGRGSQLEPAPPPPPPPPRSAPTAAAAGEASHRSASSASLAGNLHYSCARQILLG